MICRLFWASVVAAAAPVCRVLTLFIRWRVEVAAREAVEMMAAEAEAEIRRLQPGRRSR